MTRSTHVLFMRHLGRLLCELLYFSVVNRQVWLLSLVVMLLVIGLIVVVGQAAAPFIYTVF